MTISQHVCKYHAGIDARATDRHEWSLGYCRWSRFLHPADHFFSSFVADGGLATSASMVPVVLSAAPFTADTDGETFPVGTVWVVLVAAATAITTSPRAPGNVSATITVLGAGGSGGTVGRMVAPLYLVTGVPVGATGTIELKKHTAGTVMSTLTVSGSNGPNQTLLMPEYSGFTGDTLDIKVTWAGGVPVAEGVGVIPMSGAVYYAVPGTLPVGYTARSETDTNRGGDFQPRTHGNPWRPLAGPNTTYESLGLFDGFSTSNGPAGVACIGLSAGQAGTTGNNIWVGGQLQKYPWMPIAVNQAVYTVASGLVTYPLIFVGPPPVPPDQPPFYATTITGFGYRASRVIISGGSTGGLPVTFELLVDGAVVWTQTYTDAQIMAGQTVLTGAIMPSGALGSTVDVTAKVYTTGGHYTGLAVDMSVHLSPRCDIPFPWSVGGEGLTAPGGYLPSKLGTPANGQPLTRLDAGVTSTSITQKSCRAWLPAANGWYKVTLDGADVAGIGEYVWGHTLAYTVQRGHAGRPFYAKTQVTVYPKTAVLTAFTPSITAIASGGTSLNTFTGGGKMWAWGSIAAPAAGRYKISVVITNTDQLKRGATLDWSLSDTTVLTPDGSLVFESLVMPVASSYAGEQNAPAAVPSGATIEAWIVGSAPTGAWVGHAGEIAAWDRVAVAWRYWKPQKGMYLSSSTTVWRWYDGFTWKTQADPVIETYVTVPGAQTISILLGALTSERDAAPTPTATVSWVAVP